MIDKISQKEFNLICDYCESESEDSPFDSFTDAVEFKRNHDNGWRSVQNKCTQEWSDLCPSCSSHIEIVEKMFGIPKEDMQPTKRFNPFFNTALKND